MWLGIKYRHHANAAADGAGAEEPAAEASHLARANINPATGLATDYLNRFNEAIMLLDMLSSAPEFRDEFLNWRPVSYREHFARSPRKTRHVAIAAYERANPEARAGLDELTDTMTAMLEATRVVLCTDLPPAAASAFAGEIAAALKLLVARAAAAINGEACLDDAQAQQAAVDDLMKA